jgi:uncharacterized protein (DUF1800 family)
MSSTADRSAIAHLLRRAGFGPTPAEIDAAVADGYAGTVDRLLDFSAADPADLAPAPTFAPIPRPTAGLSTAERQALQKQRAQELLSLQLWWLNRMATTAHPLREKLTLYWHGHFATSFDKVQVADFMYRQNQIFRTMGIGNFETLTQAVAKDPAMMIWLDTRTDKAAHPNENFARELMELFTLGIGNYTEDDVREAARAFTGWVINPSSYAWALQARQHDNGQKTFLGQTGNFGGEDIIHIVTNSPTSAAFLVARLWSHFAYPIATTDPIVKQLLPGYAKDLNIGNLLRAIFLHPAFANSTGLVTQPIEWAVATLRALGLPPTERSVIAGLTALGQIPFRPTNVGGWPQNDYWLTTASSLARVTFSTTAVKAAKVSASTPDQVAHMLGVTWSPTTESALQGVAANPQLLVSLALVAPEWVLA